MEDRIYKAMSQSTCITTANYVQNTFLVVSEQWIHIIFSLMLFFICIKKYPSYNDVKSDNILVVKNAGFYSPILVDFGKACLISEAKTKKLTKEEQSCYRKEHCHISPKVIDGTQSIKSDVYSVGVGI